MNELKIFTARDKIALIISVIIAANYFSHIKPFLEKTADSLIDSHIEKEYKISRYMRRVTKKYWIQKKRGSSKNIKSERYWTNGIFPNSYGVSLGKDASSNSSYAISIGYKAKARMEEK